MGKIVFVTGGIRSGKSRFVQKEAEKKKDSVTVLVSAYPCDEEMKRKIGEHRKKRPPSWRTVEVKKRLHEYFDKTDSDIIIFDCLTLYVGRLLDEGKIDSQDDLISELKDFIKLIKKSEKTTYVVSNEVGMGIIPASRIGRDFIDLLGKANQLMAEKADETYLMISGKAVRI